MLYKANTRRGISFQYRHKILVLRDVTLALGPEDALGCWSCEQARTHDEQAQDQAPS